MDECRFSHTGWTNHKYHRTRPTSQNLFSWSTNGIERFQQSRMFNETTLFKILLAHFSWLRQQGSVKELRFLSLWFFPTWGSFWLFLVHVRILLNTSNLSGFFSGGVGETIGWAGASA